MTHCPYERLDDQYISLSYLACKCWKRPNKFKRPILNPYFNTLRLKILDLPVLWNIVKNMPDFQVWMF